jgi:hypothetical protein
MLSSDSLQFRCVDALPVGSSSKPIDVINFGGGAQIQILFPPLSPLSLIKKQGN